MKGQKLNLEELKAQVADEVIEQGLEQLKGGGHIRQTQGRTKQD